VACRMIAAVVALDKDQATWHCAAPLFLTSVEPVN
jgi:hypothetical protein